MEKDRFGHLPRAERALLFEALLHCVDSNSGIGFPRYDQEHPDYHDGRNGRPVPASADRPENNVMFQMLRELSLHLADDDAVTGWRKHWILTWPQFCDRAIKAADAKAYDYVRLMERES